MDAFRDRFLDAFDASPVHTTADQGTAGDTGPAAGPVSGRARAFWVRKPGAGEIREVPLPEPGPDEVLVRTLHSGVSRGTESLVFRGEVPESQRAAMRAPFQEGDFPGPVKYGYLNVGVVERGPPSCVGRTVFCLTRTRRRTSCRPPRSSLVPDGVPPARAVLAGTVETAVNALWDAAPLVGDRVTVVGAGMVGCCVARLLAGFPGVEVTLVDADAGRADVAARARGRASRCPADAPGDRDLVVHASATSAGLQLSLDLLGADGTVTDLSWYGDSAGRAVPGRRLPLAAARHPGQPGRRGRAGPPRPGARRRPAGAGARPARATRRSTRC